MQNGVIIKITFWALLVLGVISILTLPPQTEEKDEKIKNVVGNPINTEKVRNWGYTDDYCLRKLFYKNGSIIEIPRCKF